MLCFASPAVSKEGAEQRYAFVMYVSCLYLAMVIVSLITNRCRCCQTSLVTQSDYQPGEGSHLCLIEYITNVIGLHNSGQPYQELIILGVNHALLYITKRQVYSFIVLRTKDSLIYISTSLIHFYQRTLLRCTWISAKDPGYKVL
jgi:hypothetical protein